MKEIDMNDFKCLSPIEPAREEGSYFTKGGDMTSEVVKMEGQCA